MLLIMVSCTGTKDPYDFNRRDLKDYFIGSGVVRYFLPNLPEWANYSQAGRCQRSSAIRYFDMEKLRGNFDLDYEQSVQFQYMFNLEYRRVTKQSPNGILPFKEEETLFYNVSDKVQSNFKSFKEPAYKRIHLIWIDWAISSTEVLQRLVKLMQKEQMDLGHPVFVSFCLDSDRLAKFISNNSFNHPGIKMIPSEMFSIYDQEGKKSSHFILKLNQIFSAEKQLHLYTPGVRPSELSGKIKTHRY